jgi:multicomponent K+:H+ antiporter subunit E
MKTVLAAPRLSAALLLTWLLLNGSLAPAQLLLGIIIAVAVPFFLGQCAPSGLFEGRRALLAVRLLGRVAVDIVRTNLELAARILGPESALRPRYVWVPVSLRGPPSIAVLSGIITLTPGSVSVDVTPDRRHLLLHVFDLESENDLVANIKTRYEDLLAEIFE